MTSTRSESIDDVNSSDDEEEEEEEEDQIDDVDPLKCRMYANAYPQAGDLVVVEVRKIESDLGAYCALLEYDNIEGMLLMTELQRKRIRSVKKVIKEGRQEIVEVLRVNRQKNFIDLSKKRVDVEMMPKVEDRWNKSRAAHSIMRQTCVLSNKFANSSQDQNQNENKNSENTETADANSNSNSNPSNEFDPNAKSKQNKNNNNSKNNGKSRKNRPRINSSPLNKKNKYTLKSLYKLFGWPMAKEFGHLYDAFKYAMSNWEEMLVKYPAIPADVRPFLLKNIDKRLKPQMVTVRAKIEITCFTKEGVAAIRRALKTGLQLSTEQLQIKIKLVAPPLFTVSVSTLEPDNGVELIQRVVDTIRESIEASDGTYDVKLAPTVIANIID